VDGWVGVHTPRPSSLSLCFFRLRGVACSSSTANLSFHQNTGREEVELAVNILSADVERAHSVLTQGFFTRLQDVRWASASLAANVASHCARWT